MAFDARISPVLGVDCVLDAQIPTILDTSKKRDERDSKDAKDSNPPPAAVNLEWEEWDGAMPFWKHAVAGSSAGIVEHLGMYPMDTMKTRMQAFRPNSAQVKLSLGGVFRDILGNQGPAGFMRGCSAIAAGTVPAHVALFSSYEFTKKRLLEGREHDPVRAAFCGATATFSHDLILTPMDVVKQRMQLGCYNSVGDCIRQIAKTEGAAALFRSMPTTLAMNIPFGSVLVATNETIKDSLRLDAVRDHKSVLGWYFLSAGISGALAAAVTQPLDVIKTRLQTQDCLVSQSSSAERGVVAFAPKYSGFALTLRTIVREEGLRALYRGVVPRMLYNVPAAAMCWGTYESVKAFLRT